MAAKRKERTIVLDKKKLIIGSIIGILLCVICAVFFSVKAGAVFFVGFVAVGAVRLNIHSDRWVRILRAVWLCTAIICTAEASQMIADGRHLWELRDWAGVIDVLCTASLVLVIGFIVGEIRAAWLISTFIVLLFSLVNAYVVKFRGNAMFPHDIFSAGTALTVAPEYQLFVTVIQFYGIALTLLILFSSFCISDFSTRKMKRRIPLRLEYIFLLIPVFLITIFSLHRVKIETYQNEGALLNGFLTNFSAQLLDEVRDKTPDNYSLEKIAGVENEYMQKTDVGSENAETGIASYSGRQPNIIVIMDESFADLHVLGENFNTREDDVYEAAGMELPAYNQFLLDTEKIVPAVNAKGYYSISCGDFLSFDEVSEKASDEEKQALSRYEILEYNSLFDLDNRSKVFFGTEENE